MLFLYSMYSVCWVCIVRVGIWGFTLYLHTFLFNK